MYVCAPYGVRAVYGERTLCTPYIDINTHAEYSVRSCPSCSLHGVCTEVPEYTSMASGQSGPGACRTARRRIAAVPLPRVCLSLAAIPYDTIIGSPGLLWRALQRCWQSDRAAFSLEFLQEGRERDDRRHTDREHRAVWPVFFFSILAFPFLFRAWDKSGGRRQWGETGVALGAATVCRTPKGRSDRRLRLAMRRSGAPTAAPPRRLAGGGSCGQPRCLRSTSTE